MWREGVCPLDWAMEASTTYFSVVFSFDLRSRNGIFKAKSIFTLRIFRRLSLFPFPSLILFVWGVFHLWCGCFLFDCFIAVFCYRLVRSIIELGEGLDRGQNRGEWKRHFWFAVLLLFNLCTTISLVHTRLWPILIRKRQQWQHG